MRDLEPYSPIIPTRQPLDAPWNPRVIFLSGEIAREFIFPFLSRFNYNPIIPSIVFRDYYVLTDERVRGFFPLDNFMQISRYPRHTPRQT